MYNEKRILIIGGSGFVGSAILKAFAGDSGDLEIFAVQNQTALTNYPNVKKVDGSLIDVPAIIDDIKPGIIIHAARISGKSYRFLGRKKAAFLGKRANTKIFNKIKQRHVKLLYISGSLIYGSNPGKKVTEDFPVKPISYAIDYQHAERPFLKGHKDTPVMICRPGWIFGADSWFTGFFEDIIKQQGYVPQYGDGKNFMSIIHLDDLAGLVKTYALEAPFSAIYNLISPIGLTHGQFVNKLSEIYKKDIKIFSKEDLIRDYGRVTCDALTCDIPMATNYTTVMEKFTYHYPTVEDLLQS